jgi:hypothetical protein
MQQREPAFDPRSPLEAILARQDEPALDYVTDELMTGGVFSDPPPVPVAQQSAGRDSVSERAEEPVEAG